MQSWIFLLAILGIAIVAHNKSLIIATVIVMVLKLLMPYTNKIMSIVNSKGINWGILLISISILIPIATGKITLVDLVNTFKEPIGWIAILCGIGVSLFTAKGTQLIDLSPQVTVALVVGTIIGVVIFRGVAAGPLIAAGMTYYIFTLYQILFNK